MSVLSEIYPFFNQLKSNSGAIWVENNAVKLSTPASLRTKDTKNLVEKYKTELTQLLTENKVFSKNDFKNRTIFTFRATPSYDLSFAQERLWFMEHYENGTSAYHIPDIYEFDSTTDKEGIKYAFQKVISRHEILRSTIAKNNATGTFYQSVRNQLLDFEEIRLNDEQGLNKIIEDDINKPFDLSREFPIRVKFYEVVQNEYTVKTVMLINIHHIASDGWSHDILLKELVFYYETYIKKEFKKELPPLDIQYKDFALWQRSCLVGDVLNQQLDYWKNKLKNFQPLQLPTDFSRSPQKNHLGESLEFTLKKGITGSLKDLAQSYGVTLHSILLAALQVLMGKYSGQDDVIIGSPTANRNHRQLDELIGFFVNTQANRIILEKNESFDQLLLRVYESQIEAQLYQDVPFEKLVDELKVKRDLSQHPVFSVVFGVQSFGNQFKGQDNSKYLKKYTGDVKYDFSRFDLTILADDSGSDLVIYINFDTTLFSRKSIERLYGHFENCLSQLITSPSGFYSKIKLLGDKEYDQLISGWTKTNSVVPLKANIVEAFHDQVLKTPDKAAVIFEGNELTYKELDVITDKLAYNIKTENDIKPNDIVGIMLDRSEKILISQLAILKAGGAFVYIDPDDPPARKEFIINDASLNLIISQTDYLFDLNFYKGGLFAIDVQLDTLEFNGVFDYEIDPDSLAYVVYTSGTTGNPKGVLVGHTGIVNLVENQISYTLINSQDTALQFASFAFDASVSEIFLALISGAKLCIAPGYLRKDLNQIGNFIKSNKVSVATIPPSMLNVINKHDFATVRTMIIAGETCSESIMKEWSEGRRLINAYGPTECTVCATMHVYEAGHLNTNIGKPLKNMAVYILDDEKNPAPVGIAGELHIAGIGIAKGYLNHPKLTEKCFSENIFATQSDKERGYDKLYNTGDLARWTDEGDVIFLGRKDSQVKINGYRVELSEIEHALSNVEGVNHSCVLVKDTGTGQEGGKMLVGYYVPDKFSFTARRDYVSQKFKNIIDSEELSSVLFGDNISVFTYGKSEAEFLYNEIFKSEIYSSEIHLREGDTVFDVGANIGMASIFFSKQARGLNIYSFEPIKKLYDILNMNLFIQSANANFKTFNYGLGKENSDNVKFTFFKNNTALSGQYANEPDEKKLMTNFLANTKGGENADLVDFIVTSNEESICSVRTLSAFLQSEKVDRIDLLKIDVEKAEADVIEGIANEDWEKIQQIIMEVHDIDNRLEIISSKLRQKNFKVKTFEERELTDTGLFIIVASKVTNSTSSGRKNEPFFLNNPINDMMIEYKKEVSGYSTASSQDILEQLEKLLPPYMIPNVLVSLSEFPLNRNGKIDKAALPEVADIRTMQSYDPPNNDIEKRVCKIWEDILGLEKVGVSDNFFRIGGNSLLAIQVSHEMTTYMNADIKVADIFKFKNIKSLLANVPKNPEPENTEKEF